MPYLLVEAPEGQGLAVHGVRLGAKAVEDAAELYRDVAAAHNRDLPFGGQGQG